MCSEEKSRDTEEEDICPTGLKANFQGEQSNRNAQIKQRGADRYGDWHDWSALFSHTPSI